MLNHSAILFSLCLAAGDPVTATKLDGTSVEGELTSFEAAQIVLSGSEGTVAIPREQLLSIQWENRVKSVPENLSVPSPVAISLTDGSRLALSKFEVDGEQALLTTPLFEEPLRIDRRLVQSVRFQPLDDVVAASWDDLMTRNARDDLLVFRKEDVLDYVGGVVGQVTDEKLTLIVRGRELSTPRERVFGIIYAGRTSPKEKLVGEVTLASGDRLQASDIAFKERQWQVTLRAGTEVTLPAEYVSGIDFGGGRLRYLSDLAYDDGDSVDPHPGFPGGSVVWFVSNDSPIGLGEKGLPLKVGNEEFRRGVWLHSGAVVRYRLNREYRRLQAVAGFELTDRDRMPKFDPQVRLVIEGDGKELYSRSLNWRDKPEELDLDVTGVRDLTVRVISEGKFHGILERVALGDARLIK